MNWYDNYSKHDKCRLIIALMRRTSSPFDIDQMEQDLLHRKSYESVAFISKKEENKFAVLRQGFPELIDYLIKLNVDADTVHYTRLSCIRIMSDDFGYYYKCELNSLFDALARTEGTLLKKVATLL